MKEMRIALFLASALLLGASGIFSSSNTNIFSIYGNAYAQTFSDPGANPDLAGPGDNLTGMPSDNSTGLGSVPGIPGGDLGAPGDNTTGFGSPGSLDIPGQNATDLGPGPAVGNFTEMTPTQQAQNSTSSTVPEFGPVASAMLVLSIAAIILLSARTRTKF